MDTFLKLNKDKLKPVFTRLSLSCLGFVFVILAIPYVTGNFLRGQLLGSILLVAGIGFPILIILLGYLGWTINRKRRQQVFAKSPFNGVESIGFYKSFIDDTKWAFKEEVKEGKVDGFSLRMDIARERRHAIEFDTSTEWKKLDKTEYRRLTEKFKPYNVEFKMGGLTKYYDTEHSTLKTVSDLNDDLKLFTAMLRQEGFEPKVGEGWV